MHKDQREELRRLEQALLEADGQEAEDSWEVTEAQADDWLDELFQEFEEDPAQCPVYNTDQTDVDMESYSEAVGEAPERGGCAICVFLVLISVLGAGVLWFLKKWGIL